MKQLATINTMHSCPMQTGGVPHVGGPIIGPGCSGVKVNGIPISLRGDKCLCNGSQDTVIEGCLGILVNGTPIVTQGCSTAHGGTIPQGMPGVIVSSTNQSGTEILVSKEPVIYNLQWLREDTIIKESKRLRRVVLGADVRNILDGETITININRNLSADDTIDIQSLEGVVKNNRVEVEWEIEECDVNEE